MSGLERLKKRREFLRVAGFKRRFVTPGLILQVAPHIDDESARGRGEAPPRVGFTVSRRVGGAVERNRARRRLRAAAREVLEPHAVPGRDYVIVGRAATLRRPYDALVGDLVLALRKTECYRDEAP